MPNPEPQPSLASDAQMPGALKSGAIAAWPICLGYVPIGLAFGVIAQQASLGPLYVALMSIFVFAGSTQFIAVAMLDGGATALTIIVTTFIVNIRHLLMSSALALHFRGAHRGLLSLFSYGVTDESFAVNSARLRDGNWRLTQALATNQVANLTWIISTTLGAVIGQFIPVASFGIDYALPAMFICLLVLQLRGTVYIFTAVIAALLAVSWKMLVPGDSYIMVASIGAASAGFWWRRRSRGGK